MKFGKAFESNAKAMPEKWRPYVIHYKALKKKIDAIVEELYDRDLQSPVIKSLLSPDILGDVQRKEYSVGEEKGHITSCIKVVLNNSEPNPQPVSQEEQLSALTSDLHEQMLGSDLLISKEISVGVHDHQTVAVPSQQAISRFVATPGPYSEAAYCFCRPSAVDTRTTMVTEPSTTAEASRSASYVPPPLSQPLFLPGHINAAEGMLSPEQKYDEPMEILATPGVLSEQRSLINGHIKYSNSFSNQKRTRVLTVDENGKRILVIELMADTAFFDELAKEVSQLSKLLQAIKQEFESKVEGLSKILTVVSSPYNKDMYAWREILKVYRDAQVFVGEQESDRSSRSSEKAQGRLHLFMKEIARRELTLHFKQEKSKIAFNSLFQLNCELIMMKQFKELNKSAITKILDTHDKRTNLTATSWFPKHLQHEPFYNNCISKAITYTIECQLLSIIPQPDDYACPICMGIAWKPIRLNCSHVFCVRCLVKAQRKKMLHCPICRHPNSVLDAKGSNLDVSLTNFMKLYFPKEVKVKQKESNREQAAEEMEALTGQRWTEASDPACVIM
ncbi:hypothetical protein EC957_008474 [Mortierella hygrophila]|uniref:SPX domain-containing protein n=1 Tax=Mortierella hygrophila TaxID=979708 RepID=A0A9P6EX22_9FUNG|nr:hypothetical protein EC957_008474 [Mortierella hygrophila]